MVREVAYKNTAKNKVDDAVIKKEVSIAIWFGVGFFSIKTQICNRFP